MCEVSFEIECQHCLTSYRMFDKRKTTWLTSFLPSQGFGADFTSKDM